MFALVDGNSLKDAINFAKLLKLDAESIYDMDFWQKFNDFIDERNPKLKIV